MLAALNLREEAPDVFLVYAHDNKLLQKNADADVARQLIDWLEVLGARIYSDRTPTGNPLIPPAEPWGNMKTSDILYSQLGLLPSNDLTNEKRAHIIVCGSAVLNHYADSVYYQDTYYNGIKKAYEAAQKSESSEKGRSILSSYVNSQLDKENFHHVLTELAFLQLRVEKEAEHGITPFLLNGNEKQNFPTFINRSTTVRIEEGQYRPPGKWKGQETYQDQGLHQAFFKLLKRLWATRKPEIQALGVKVYEACLEELRKKELKSEKAFNQFILDTVQTAQDELIKKKSSTIRALNNQSWFDRIEKIILKGHTEKSAARLTQQLNKWYRGEELKGRLTIQRISGERLPMANCYINLAVVAYREQKDKQATATSLFHRLTSAEQLIHTNLNEPIPLEELFKRRPLKDGKEGIPKRILIRGRAGIGKTTLAEKSLYDHLS